MPYEPWDSHTVRAKRIAARCHLAFHIEMSPNPHVRIGWLTEHAGWKSETREATEPELDMWQAMETAAGDLTRATLQELQNTLSYREGICYLNAIDLVTLRHDPEFTPELRREELQDGHVGNYNKLRVYLSREIPPGWAYLPDERDEQLHWKPPSGEKQVRPPIDFTRFPMYCHPLLVD